MRSVTLWGCHNKALQPRAQKSKNSLEALEASGHQPWHARKCQGGRHTLSLANLTPDHCRLGLLLSSPGHLSKSEPQAVMVLLAGGHLDDLTSPCFCHLQSPPTLPNKAT